MNSTLHTTTTASYEGLDLSYLHAISGGDADFEKDMLQSLLAEMSEKMTALSAAIRQNDTANIRLQSHSLKNLAGIIGVPSLTHRFKAIETAPADVPNAYFWQEFLPCEGQWNHSKNLLAQRLTTY